MYGWYRMSSARSTSRKRSRSRSRNASRSPVNSRHRSHRSKRHRRSDSPTKQRDSSFPMLEQLFEKISAISSSVVKLNKRMTCLETARVNEGDNMAAVQDVTSCPEPTDVSDQLSIAVPQDAEIDGYSPVILDPISSHRAGAITGKSPTQGDNNDISCLSENNNSHGVCGKSPSEAKRPINENSAKHLFLILWLWPLVGNLLHLKIF